MSADPTHPRQDQPRPLEQLRSLIDGIDREVLQLLSNRDSLVGEVALWKREHSAPIRDFRREREILDDRRGRASSLGLSSEFIESLFRLVLWGSRNRQAALKAEVPLDVQPCEIAIIGGKGGMGRCMSNLFSELGHTVMIVDLDTDLTAEEAAAAADVVVISVPIDATTDLIRRVGPQVREHALLMDVTSVKTGPVEAMLETSAASVVGTHPLFGPSVHSLQGQRVVVCPGRGDEWRGWVERMFKARGLQVVSTSPAEHDRVMSVVQVLVHFATEVMGKTLSMLDVSIEQTLDFMSPIYLMELIMTARHFAQSSELYAAIQMSNVATPEVTSAFVDAATGLQQVVSTGDADQFAEMFEDVRSFFGSFSDQAMEQSSFLIDRLVERA